MSQIELLLAGIILAIAGHALAVIYRSPAQLFKVIEDKIDELEENHVTLDRMLTRHDEAMKNLAGAIDRLTQRIDRIEPYIKPQGRRGP